MVTEILIFLMWFVIRYGCWFKRYRSRSLRDQTVTNVFTSNTFDISAGNDFNLTAYLLGDLDGNYQRQTAG